MEAKMMLQETGFAEELSDEMVAKTAEVLELGFRKGLEDSWPDFNGLVPYFTACETKSENAVVVTEVCRFPDGGYSTQSILVGNTDSGWRVLYPLD